MHPNDKNTSRRLYLMEGGMHLYSSMPTAITPADLYEIKGNPAARAALATCNIYLVTARRRIYIDPSNVSREGNVVRGAFVVQRTSGVTHVPFELTITDEIVVNADYVRDVQVFGSGTHLAVVTEGNTAILAAHVVVAHADSALSGEDKDLEVLYVGQGIGRSGQRSAIDRLLNHTTLQRILADASTFRPNHELILLLYRFQNLKIMLSTGGDLNAEPEASSAEERLHVDRMHQATLSRHAQVALAEAGLIRHFQPIYNTQLKDSDFSARKKAKILQDLLRKDMTGLIVEISSGNVRSRLRTESAHPIDISQIFDEAALTGSRLESEADKRAWAAELHQMEHSHFAQFALTTPDERDSFVHGTRWQGETQRDNVPRS